MFTFCIPKSVFSIAVPETYIIPCYFCHAKFFKILWLQVKDFLFTPHQMSDHLRLKAMLYWKQLTGQLQPPFLPSTQTCGVKTSFAHFFSTYRTLGVRLMNFFPTSVKSILFRFSRVCSHKLHLKKHKLILKLFVTKNCSKNVKLTSSNDTF